LSRNFELLRRVEQEQTLLSTPVETVRAVPPDVGWLQPSNSAPVREEEVRLVQHLFLSSTEAPRVVVFCGVEPGYGPAWVCARASEVLAGRGAGSVCAVDASFRLPHLHQYFGVESPVGLTDALLNPGAVGTFAQQTGRSNLWVISSGSQASDPYTVLKPDRLQSRLTELRAQFDYILVSTPPANLSADAVILSQLSDGVVLVLEANSSRRDVAQKAKLSLEAANVKVLGAVLNNRTFPIPEAIYRKL
jgi:capsular exopolysaccharide synthesis family protein